MATMTAATPTFLKRSLGGSCWGDHILGNYKKRASCPQDKAALRAKNPIGLTANKPSPKIGRRRITIDPIALCRN